MPQTKPKPAKPRTPKTKVCAACSGRGFYAKAMRVMGICPLCKTDVKTCVLRQHAQKHRQDWTLAVVDREIIECRFCGGEGEVKA